MSALPSGFEVEVVSAGEIRRLRVVADVMEAFGQVLLAADESVPVAGLPYGALRIESLVDFAG